MLHWSIHCIEPSVHPRKLCVQVEEVTGRLETAQQADESHRAAVSKQLKEHARHAEELSGALEQAKAALSSQQHQALEDLQAHTQGQTAELEQRMSELREQVTTAGQPCMDIPCCEAGDRLSRRKAGSPGKILIVKQSVSVAMS